MSSLQLHASSTSLIAILFEVLPYSTTLSTRSNKWLTNQQPATMAGGSHGRSFLVSLGQYFTDTEKYNRIPSHFIPHLGIFKVYTLLVVFVDGWHISECDFVINNYVLPKDVSERPMDPERTTTPKSANNSAAILGFTLAFAKVNKQSPS